MPPTHYHGDGRYIFGFILIIECIIKILSGSNLINHYDKQFIFLIFKGFLVLFFLEGITKILFT